MPEELYRKHRPTKLSKVRGQESAVAQIQAKFAKGKWPHATLFFGPSGTGKTTLARYLAARLGAHRTHVSEFDASEKTGIDAVRALKANYRTKPMLGQARVWIIDEAHGLTTPAQNTLLKMLEEAPAWTYFVLCTTNPEKLLKTVKTRCTKIKLGPLSDEAMKQVLQDVAAKEFKVADTCPPDDVFEYIVQKADGSAREALVLLDQVKDLKTPAEMYQAIDAMDARKSGFDLAKMLFAKTRWADVKGLVKEFKDRKEDMEEVRRTVLGYAASVCLGGGKMAERANVIFDLFRDPFDVTGPAGLVFAAYNACKGN